MKRYFDLHNKLEKVYREFKKNSKSKALTSGPYKGYKGIEINPKPYIWHISDFKNAKSIDKYGLKAKSNNYFGYGPAVFANNLSKIDYRVYDKNAASWEYNYYGKSPICVCSENNEETFFLDGTIDFYNPSDIKLKYRMDDYFAWLEYDFWRIDTSMLKGYKWWIDTMWTEESGNGDTNWYIYTNKSIPRKAIKLYRFYHYDRFFINKGAVDGVYHSKYIPKMYEVKSTKYQKKYKMPYNY
jgi:hypothetical protein